MIRFKCAIQRPNFGQVHWKDSKSGQWPDRQVRIRQELEAVRMQFDQSVHAGTFSGELKAKRQHVMVLCLATSALDGEVRAWSVYDPSVEKRPTAGDSDVPPYATGLDALKDGWRVIQFPQLIPPAQGSEYSTSYMRFEFIFEKMEEIE